MDSFTAVEARPVALDPPAPIEPAHAIDAYHDAEAPLYYLADDDDDDRSGREWYARATDLYHDERYERAGEAYENAARRGYRRDTALYNAGCSYALAGQKGRAIDMLRESFAEGFDRLDLFAGDEDLNSLRGDPRFQDLMDDVMSSDSAESARRSAKRDFQRLAGSKDIDEGDWNGVGIELLRSGDYEGAATAFENEFKVSGDEDALYNKACARSLAGKKDDALKLLEQSITTGSVDADHMRKDPDLIALHDQKRFGELTQLAEDLSLSGGWNDDDVKWFKRGDHKKYWHKSIAHFEEVTQKHPKIGRAWFNLGYAQIESGEAKASAASFQKALDLGYRPKTTMYNLACAAAQSDDADAAISWLEKSEKAGMELWNHALWDDDLDPIRDDSRFKAMAKRWKATAKQKHAQHGDWDWDGDEWHWNDDDDDDRDTDT
jgi:tetratricopeptide (TPR) repeat protein